MILINKQLHKKSLFFIFLFSVCQFTTSCNGSKEENDADAGEPDMEIMEMEIQDEVTIDTDEMDLPSEELEPLCPSIPISCGGRMNETVQPAPAGTLDKYILNERPLEYSEEGGESVFQFEVENPAMVRVSTNRYGSGDIDIIVLKDSCDASKAIMFGDSVAFFRAYPESVYYIVIDGRNGGGADFEIYVECNENFEQCGNSVDDNGDGLIDCLDPTCKEEPPCYELYCSDGSDDDNDGDIDCRDFDCMGAVSCVGGSGEIGDPCTSHSDCKSGKCYMELETGWPGGYCIQVSSIRKCGEFECPAGTACEPIGFVSVTGPWACARECSESEPCREGYLCEDHLCFPLCTSAEQCAETGFCNYDTGKCTTETWEICSGGNDEDGDTTIDCNDTDCMFKTSCVTPSHLQGGDNCEDAAQIPLPEGETGTIVVTGTTALLSDDFTPSCEAIDSADAVYYFTISQPSHVMIDLQGGRVEPRIQDTILVLKQDCHGEDIACNNDIRDGVYSHSFIDISLDAGTYFIIVDGFDGLKGDYNLGVNISR